MKNVKAIAIALAAVFTLSIAGNSEAFSLKKTFKGAKKGISKTVKKTKRTISKTVKVARKQTKKTAKVVYKQTQKTAKVVYKQTRKVTNPIKRTIRKTGKTLKHGIRKTGRVIGHTARKTGKAIKKGAISTYRGVKRIANKVCRESNRALETTYNGAKRGTKKHVGRGWGRNTAEFATDVTFDYGADRLVGGACATQRIVLNPVKSFNKTKGSVHKLGKGLSRFSKDPVRHTGNWGKGAVYTLAQAPKNIASGNSSSEREQVSTARNMIDPLSYMDPGE